MVSRFAAEFAARFPDLAGARIVVALSGGADSVALLHLLAESFAQLACRPVAVHVHHHARGAEADRDAEFCVALCDGLGVEHERLDIDSPPPPKTSREAFWRAQRYELLEGARRRLDCAAVATGHTLDDQAETVLLKLLRGSGPRGVAGIRRRHGSVIRPLLSLGRDELRSWLASRALRWCEDSTNAGPEQPRGFVRHRVLPLLRAHQPAVVGHLAAFAAVLAEDESLLEDLTRQAGPQLTPRHPAPLTALTALPRPLLRRWVLALAAQLQLPEPPARRQLVDVESLLLAGRPAAVDLGRRWVLRRRGGKIVLSPPPLARFEAVTVTLPSRVTLSGGFVARLGCPQAGGADHRARLAPRIGSCTLQWRASSPGDRAPRGQGRLSDRLARAGIPPEWRRAWPVLEADGTMIWVPGVDTAPGWDGDEATGVIAEVEEPWKQHARS